MNGQGRLARLLAPQILRPAAAIAMFAVFGLALWVIHHETRTMSFEDIRAAIGNVGMLDVAAGFGLTALSFVMLIGFDALALRSSGIRVPFPRIAFAAFCAQAISHTAGFAALTGTSVRLRVYGNAGVPPAAVAKLMVFCATAFTLGAVTLGGLAGLFEGGRVAAALNLPETLVHLAGILALAAFLIYAVASARGVGLQVRSWRIAVPALPVTIGQTLLAIGDLITAGAVLWVLLPADLPLSFPAFLGLYVVAIVAGVLAHVPAGLGVFEGIVLLFLPGVPAPEVLGALVVYRFVYNLVPLILAATLIALAEAGRAAGRMAPAIRRAGAGAAQIAPIAFALLAIASGAVLLASAATPAASGRLDLLGWLPLAVIETSHVASGVVGLLLLVIARGLARRVDAAWMAATILSALGAVLSLLKGWDWEEASLLAVVGLLLVLARRAFYRRGSLLRQPMTPAWVGSLAMVVGAAAWLAWFSFRHEALFSQGLFTFALEAEAPRSLRATVAVLALGLVLFAARLFAPVRARPGPPTAEDLVQAERIVAASTSSTAQLAFTGDKSFIFSECGDAFVMYAASGRSLVAMGDPIGPRHAWANVAWMFRELCDAHGAIPVFYQVSAEALPLYLDLGLRIVKLGEEAVVPLTQFSLDGKPRAELRYAHRRAIKDGASFEMLAPGEARLLMPELRKVSDVWMEQRQAREKRFSLGRFEPAYLNRCPIAVARQHGRIVAFANLWPSAGHEEMALDLMRHLPDAGYGIMDYLMVEIMLHARDAGWKYFSLGMTPLAGLPDNPLASAWSRVGTFIYEHGEGIYNFQGLRRFKQKFLPDWRPRYLASPGGTALPQVGLDVVALISGGIKGVIGR